MSKLYNHVSCRFLYLICLLLIIVTPVFSQTLDAKFGNGGKVVTPINDSSAANSIAIQDDGKIIIGGYTTVAGRDRFALVRYNVNGSLDSTFGIGGKVVAQIKDRSSISSIAIQADGKILAGGSVFNDNRNVLLDSSYTIVRYTKDGSIDSLFGKNGIATVKMSNGLGELKKLLVKPDGKILTAGTVGAPVFENILALVQFTPDGSLDSSFGSNGKLEGYINDIEEITDIGLGKDGKIYAIGQMRNWSFIGDFALLRFLQNGTVDSSFGTNGVVKTDFNDNRVNNLKVENAQSLIILPDSSIVVAGYNFTTPSTFALAKYKMNGSLDSTFGTDGKVITPVHNLYGYPNDILSDAAGNLYVSGYVSGSSNNSDFAIAKYFSDATLDSSFGRSGIDTTDFFGFSDVAYVSVLQSDAKIILAGHAGISSDSYGIALARYTMSALPLRLINFYANKNGEKNLLQWQTAQEINVDRYEIERSADGREYSVIGRINAGLSKYNFTDDKPLTGKNYYRLNMIDRDGKFEYSPMRIVINNSRFDVNIYPLPAQGKLNIHIQSNEPEKVEISLTDIFGKTLITNAFSLTAGLNNSFINVQSISKGVYFLKLATSQTTEMRKIIIGE